MAAAEVRHGLWKTLLGLCICFVDSTSVEWFLMLRQPLIGWISRFCPIKNSSSFPCKKTHTNTHTQKMGRWKWKRRQSVWSFFNICWHAIVIESGWVLKWAFSAKRETSHFHFPLSLRFSLSRSLVFLSLLADEYMHALLLLSSSSSLRRLPQINRKTRPSVGMGGNESMTGEWYLVHSGRSPV